MPELTLSRDQRLRLKSDSHHLDPTVLVGVNGLNEAVLKEIDRALTTHQLVKVRTPALERQQRELMFLEVAERLGAARIQLIGRTMVLFRPAPPADDPHPRASRAPSPASGRGKPVAGRKRAQT
jgi:RNA-binding protein